MWVVEFNYGNTRVLEKKICINNGIILLIIKEFMDP